MKRHRPTTLEPISAAMFVIISVHAGLVCAGWWWWKEKMAGPANVHEPRLSWMSPADFKSRLPATATPPVIVSNVPGPKAAGTPPAAALNSSDVPVQKATLIAPPPQQQAMEPVPNAATTTPLFAPATFAPKPSANRSITLRRAPDKAPGSRAPGTPAPPMASPTLLDVARLNTLRPPPMPQPGSVAVTEEADMDLVDEAVNAAFLAGWTAPPIDTVPASQRESRLNISIGRDGSILKAQMSKFSGSHALDQSILEAAAKVKKISTALPSNFSKESYDLELNFLLLP